MPETMIITVGTGPTVAHGICFSIRQQNPENIVFLVTRESKEKTIPIITQDKILEGEKYSEIVLSDPNDVERVVEESEEVIKSLKYKPEDIVIDYTSDTKAMSAGVTIAGIKSKIGSLVYVSGKRDNRGVVISGTERLISLEPNCQSQAHRDYLGTSNIQIRVYNDKLTIMNEGKLPPEVPVERLKTNHLSKPRNRLLARIFYDAGLIEAWGRGTLKIVENCVKQGLPEPDFIEEYGVMTVRFYKDIYTEENLRKLGLNESRLRR